MSLSKFPATSVMDFVEKLTSSISKRDVDLAYAKLMRTNQFFVNIANLGSSFIPETASSISKFNLKLKFDGGLRETARS